VDRYAVFDLGREHHLSANERWMLQALCLAADFRTCAVSATYWELSEWTGIGRDTVPKTLDALEKARLVKITHPFGQNRCGEVSILAWEAIIVEHRPPPSRIRRPANRQQVADQSRTSRGQVADKPASDQGERPFYRGEEEEGCVGDSWTEDGVWEDYGQGEGSSGGSCAAFANSSFCDTEPVQVAPPRWEGSSGESAGFDFGEANSAASGSQEDASDTVCVDCNQKGHPSQADPQCEHFEETW
jgi:hypothetical protein